MKLYERLRKIQKRLGYWYYLILLVAIAIDAFGITHMLTKDVAKATWVMELAAGGFLLLTVPFILGIAVHECGHALVAKLTDHEIYGFRIGRFERARLTTGTRWRKANQSIQTGGGVHVCPNGFTHLVKRRFFVILGGPLATAVVGFSLFFLWNVTNKAKWSDLGWLAQDRVGRELASHLPLLVAFVFILLSLDIFIPIKLGGTASDSMQLLLSLVKPGYMRQMLVASKVMVPWMYGVRAGNWDDEAIQHLLNAPDPMWQAIARLFAYYQLCDRGDVVAGNRMIIESAKLAVHEHKGITKQLKDNILMEAAYAAAHYRGSSGEGRRLLDMTEPAEKGKYSLRYRAEAAVLAGEGNLEEASGLVAKGKQLYLADNEAPFEDAVRVEIELLEGSLQPALVTL